MSKDRSHRRYIKEKINDLGNLYPVASKPDIKVSKPTRDKNQDDNGEDTSIVLNSSREISIDKKINLKEALISLKEGNSRKKSKYYMKLEKSINKKQFLKIKSEETILKHNGNNSSIRKSFSVRKRPHLWLSKSKNNIEVSDYKKNEKFQTKDGWKIKSENYLKQTQGLKKTASKLKLKVKDPFQKKMKLDNQFQNESEINHRQESFISSINEEELRQILSKIS